MGALFKRWQVGLEGGFQNGKQQGLWELYFHDGVLSWRGEYKNGKKQGLWELYFPDGVLSWRGEYKNGNKAGLRYEFLLTKIGIDED